MTRTTAAMIVVMLAACAGCAAHRERGDDAGIRTDSGADAGPMCGAILCMAGCTVVTGADGCAACRCEPPPPATCASDAECVIAYDLTPCCGGCASAVTAARAAADRCLARYGDPFPADCRPSDCTDICPAIDCANPLRAVCAAGECVPAFDCAPGDVVFRSECVPRCASHADCAIATDLLQCCGRPCDAYPRALALDRPCWAIDGETGGGCAVPPDACADLGCAFMECPAEAHAACLDDGTCAYVDTTAACPAGYEDAGGRCVLIGG